MSAPNFRISSATSSVSNGVLSLTIPVANTEFYCYGIYNVSSIEVATILVAISDGTTNSYNGQESNSAIEFDITLEDFGIENFPEDKLQVIIYNERPVNFDPAESIGEFITLIDNNGFEAWENVCEGIFNISNNQPPNEGCGGILELS